MREEDLKQFFLGQLDADALAPEVADSIRHYDEVETSIAIQDMKEDFTVTRHHLIRLSDAALANKLNEEQLNAIAFALLASDRFEFNEADVVIEVLHDWSAPEINFSLNEETLKMHQRWLIGESPLPARQQLPK